MLPVSAIKSPDLYALIVYAKFHACNNKGQFFCLLPPSKISTIEAEFSHAARHASLSSKIINKSGHPRYQFTN
jgi:hypothetical protein